MSRQTRDDGQKRQWSAGRGRVRPALRASMASSGSGARPAVEPARSRANSRTESPRGSSVGARVSRHRRRASYGAVGRESNTRPLRLLSGDRLQVVREPTGPSQQRTYATPVDSTNDNRISYRVPCLMVQLRATTDGSVADWLFTSLAVVARPRPLRPCQGLGGSRLSPDRFDRPRPGRQLRTSVGVRRSKSLNHSKFHAHLLCSHLVVSWSKECRVGDIDGDSLSSGCHRERLRLQLILGQLLGRLSVGQGSLSTRT